MSALATKPKGRRAQPVSLQPEHIRKAKTIAEARHGGNMSHLIRTLIDREWAEFVSQNGQKAAAA